MLGCAWPRGWRVEAQEEQCMSQCLRCSKSCEATSVFCQACRSHLRSQLWQEANTLPEASVTVSPVVAVSSESVEVSADADDDLWDRITSPQPIVSAPSLPQTPPPLSPSLPEAYNNSDIASVVDRAIQKLNQAAQCIAKHRAGAERFGPCVDGRWLAFLEPVWPESPDRVLSLRRLQRQLDNCEDLLRRRDVEARLGALIGPIHESEPLHDGLWIGQIEASAHGSGGSLLRRQYHGCRSP